MTELDDIESELKKLMNERNDMVFKKESLEKQIEGYNIYIKTMLEKRRKIMRENSGG